MAISDPKRVSPKALTTGAVHPDRASPVGRIVASGGGGGLSATGWKRLHPLDGNTTQAINWSAGVGSDPQNYDAPRDVTAPYETRVTAASDDGITTTIEFSGATDGGNANLQDQIMGCCLWTWPLTDIWNAAIDMTKPFHVTWMLEAMESNGLGFSPYFPDFNKVQVLAGVVNKPIRGFSGGLPQEYHSKAASHLVGLRVGNSRHIHQLVCMAARPYTNSKPFVKPGTGTTNKVIGHFMQGIDRVPILTAETWKNDPAKPNPPVYEHDKAGQMDITTDADTLYGADTTGYFLLGVGRTGTSANNAATTMKFRLHINAVNIGTSWAP